MSKFPNQLALVSVSIIALTAATVGLSERAAHRAQVAAEAEAHAAEEAARIAAAEASLAERAEAVAEEVVADVADAAGEVAGTVAGTVEEVAEAVEAAVDEPVSTARADSAPAPEPGPPAPDATETAETQDATMHGHGDAGTAPIASILAGAAVAQSVDSPAIDATGVEYGLGREALPEEIAAWDIDIRPDGTGLPEGSGDVWTGEEVFVEQCAVCHGDFAEGVGRWPVLAGGLGSLTRDRPIKTVGSYWPYLSTVYDYVHRAMPFGNAQSLEPDQIYAITAYLLYSNGIVEDDFVLSKENFTEVRLPNEGNFFMDDREEGEIPAFTREVCMEDCKDEVEITMRAAVLDVTPESGGDGADLEGGGGAPASDSAGGSAAVEETTEMAAAPADSGGAASGDAAGAETVGAEAEAEAVAAVDPELVAQGEAAFRQCKACHQVGEGADHRVGPQLNDLFGRTAGSMDGFRYSTVMAEAGEEGLVWTPETLHDFLGDPRGYLRGTKMSFTGFREESDIAAVTAYLSTFDE